MIDPAPRLIARSRLLRRLQAALKTSHVLLRAPAGYGKTSLLRLLAAQQPNSFFSMLELGDADAAQLQAQLAPGLTPGATLLLDDAQVLVGAEEALAWLVEQAHRLPLRLVFSGRQMPLTAAVLGAATFTEHDLAFTLNESEALLAAAGLAGEPLLAGWHARTAGWPLALALLARRPEPLPALDPGQSGEPPAELFGYLAETLLRGSPPEVRRFMALTAVPLRFNDALAAALLKVSIADAAAARAEVLRRNLFLGQAEAAAPGWFRYHDLIREFMLAQLAALGEDRRARFGQAAQWFAAQGDLPQAIEHALAGGLSPLAAELIARLPLEFVRNEGRYRTFRRWVLSLDEAVLAADPLPLERLGAELLDIGRYDEAWQILQRALALAEAKPNQPVRERVRLTMVKAHRLVGQSQAAADLCQVLLADPALPSELRRQALNHAGSCYAQLSQFGPARRAYLQAIEIDEQVGTLPTAFIAGNLVNVVLVPLGDFETARALLEANDVYFADKPVGSSFHWLIWCSLHEARGEWAAMAQDLARAVAADAQLDQPDAHDVWTPWEHTLLHTGLGQLEAAGQFLAQAEAVVSPNPEELLCVAIAKTWLRRREGRFQEAAAAAQAILDQAWESPLYRAILALERDLALAAGGSRAALHPETINVARLRARAHTLRLRALLAVRCWRSGQPRWRRQAAAVLRALQRPGYAGLLTQRDPDLAGQFWVICLREGLAVEQALEGLLALNNPQLLLPLLADREAGARTRAAEGLGRLGREEGMPGLAAALAAETNATAGRALEAALEALEQAPPPPLTVRLMGEFAVRRGEQELSDWHRPAVRRLFQYFVLHHGERLARERILEDLWPAADPATARASFNQAFSWLRRLLEPAMRPRAASRYLALGEDSYCFDPRHDRQVAAVDIEAFEAAVKPSLALAEAADLPPLPDDLLRALEAWQPLLPEAAYESWTVEPRERLLNLYVAGCLYAARGLLERARPAEAAPWAARVTAAAPWHEEAYQVLMQAQARQGQRSLALKTFAEAVAALERELNAAPSVLTRWLGQRLQCRAKRSEK